MAKACHIRGKRVRALLSGFTALVLALTGSAAGLFTGAAGAYADYAKTGSGPYQQRIYWFNMANFPLNTINGSQDFEISPGISAKVTLLSKNSLGAPGDLSLAARDVSPAAALLSAYGPLRQSSVGNVAPNAQLEFTLGFALTVNGRQLTPQVVVADAEATRPPEALQFTTAGTNWEDFQDIRTGTAAWGGATFRVRRSGS